MGGVCVTMVYVARPPARVGLSLIPTGRDSALPWWCVFLPLSVRRGGYARAQCLIVRLWSRHLLIMEPAQGVKEEAGIEEAEALHRREPG